MHLVVEERAIAVLSVVVQEELLSDLKSPREAVVVQLVVDERAIGVVREEVHVVVELGRVRLDFAESAYGLAIEKSHRIKSVKRVDRNSMIGNTKEFCCFAKERLTRNVYLVRKGQAIAYMVSGRVERACCCYSP